MEISVGLTFVTGTINKFLFGSGTDNPTNRAATEYLQPSGQAAGQYHATENLREITAQRAFTITDMDAKFVTAPGATNAWTITINEDTTATAVTCDMSGTTDTCDTAFSGSEAVANNAEITIELAEKTATATDSTGSMYGLAGTVP